MNADVVKEMKDDPMDEKKMEAESPRPIVDKIETTADTAEGVEVVLGTESGTAVISDSPERPPSNQNVFRRPQAVRPRAMRPPNYPPYNASGSWGYPRHPEYGPPPHPPPYPVPSYNSGSFDDSGYRHHPPSHYSPHVPYHHGHRYPGQDVNVVSPNHKAADYRPPMTPRPHYGPPPRNYYQYPPTSPVSRPSGGPAGPPRVHQYAMRRGEQQGYHKYPDHAPATTEGSWHPYPQSHSSTNGGPPQPPIVNEASFDSGLARESGSGPPTPHSSHPPPPPSADAFYGGGSWGSFDSAAPPPPPHFDDARYYGYPDAPYSPAIYHSESFPPQYPLTPYSLSYDENDHRLHDYNPDRDSQLQKGPSKKNVRKASATPVTSNKKQDMLLPKAAEEVDFEVTDPPMEPVLPPSTESACESLADVNGYDVLCGRGGGTNSQVGNRRFRKLVQDFQPTYLLARRKEKPLLARTIVLIIRKRGGRFLKKDEDNGALYDVGDAKAEAKTSQALREGLDVRATKSASDHLKKKKMKKDSKSLADSMDEAELSPLAPQSSGRRPGSNTDSPPPLPRLHDGPKSGLVHPHSPDRDQHRKRHCTRSACAPDDKFFPDFCPPRADIRGGEDDDDDGVVDTQYVNESVDSRGCAGIALDMVTGAATGSFCLGPTGWRRS